MYIIISRPVIYFLGSVPQGQQTIITFPQTYMYIGLCSPSYDTNMHSWRMIMKESFPHFCSYFTLVIGRYLFSIGQTRYVAYVLHYGRVSTYNTRCTLVCCKLFEMIKCWSSVLLTTELQIMNYVRYHNHMNHRVPHTSVT